MLVNIFIDFINLIFPRTCFVCHQPLVKKEQWLCACCMLDLPYTNDHLEQNNPVLEKFLGRLPISHAMSLFRFRTGNIVQKMVHALKYEKKPEIGFFLGCIYGGQLKNKFGQHYFSGIIPVPIHPKRLRQRGYNQSEYFAKGLASLLAIPVFTDYLIRTKNTITQTKKGQLERIGSLEQAFSLTASTMSIEENTHLLLVDDIITTGATLEACAWPLIQDKRVKKLSIATIGMVE